MTEPQRLETPEKAGTLRERYLSRHQFLNRQAELNKKIVFEQKIAKGIKWAKDGIVFHGQTYYEFDVVVAKKSFPLSFLLLFAYLDALDGPNTTVRVAYKALPGPPERYITLAAYVREMRTITEDMEN